MSKYKLTRKAVKVLQFTPVLFGFKFKKLRGYFAVVIYNYQIILILN